MRKITFLAAFLVAIFTINAQNAPLTNGTFDADISGWVGNNTTPVWNAAEGNPGGALEFQSTANNNRVNTNPNVAPYDGPGDYTLSFDVKGTAGTVIRPALFQGTGINGTDITIAADNTWESHTETFTGLTADQMNIRFFGRPNGVATPVTYFIDNVTWVKVPCAGQEVIAATDGAGTNVITAPQGCYNTGDMVEFTATPACANFTFNEWVVNGVPSGNMNPFNYTVGTVDATVTATFNPVTPAPDLNFDTDAELANWTANGNAIETVSGDDISIEITGGTPKITYNCALAPTTWNVNACRITYTNNTTNTVIRVKHTNAISGGDNYVNETITPNGTGTVVIPLNNTEFVDKVELTEILIRNAGNTDASNGIIVFDFIEFYNEPSLSVDSFNKTSGFTLYPNPANSELNFSNPSVISQVTVFDITGKQVIKSKQLTNGKLNISTLTTGVYLVKIVDQNNSSTTKKLVKE